MWNKLDFQIFGNLTKEFVRSYKLLSSKVKKKCKGKIKINVNSKETSYDKSCHSMPALKTSKRCNQRNKYYLRVYLDSVNTYQKEIQAYVWSLSEKDEELSGKKHFVL